MKRVKKLIKKSGKTRNKINNNCEWEQGKIDCNAADEKYS